MTHDGDRVFQPLSRILAKEERVSDLIALLAALDPEPLRRALGIEPVITRIEREVVLAAAGRADLLAYGDTGVVALIEVKESAAEHGGQFAAYEAWASGATSNSPRCFAATLDTEVEGLPDGWTHVPLPELVGAWESSSDANAQWLGRSIATVLRRWVAEVADEPIGAASSRVVADLITRRAARALGDTVIPSAGEKPVVLAERDSGGNAALVAWLPYPNGEPDCWLCVGTRSLRKSPSDPWRIRLGIEVGLHEGDSARSVSDARVLAHDLAAEIVPALRLSSMQAYLESIGRRDLAGALSARRDGLRQDPGSGFAAQWKALVATGGSGRATPHPVLFHDWGRRLASSLTLRVDEVKLVDLVTLMTAALDHLQVAATTEGSTDLVQSGGSQAASTLE